MGTCMSKGNVQESVIHHISSPVRTDDGVGFALARLSNSHQARWVKYDDVAPSEMDKPVVSESMILAPPTQLKGTVTSQQLGMHPDNCGALVINGCRQSSTESAFDKLASSVSRPQSLTKNSSGGQSREGLCKAVGLPAKETPDPRDIAAQNVDYENVNLKSGFKSSIKVLGQKSFPDDNTRQNCKVPSKKGRQVLKETNQNCRQQSNSIVKAHKASLNEHRENVKVEDMLPRRVSLVRQRPSLTEKEFQALEVLPLAKAPAKLVSPEGNSMQRLFSASLNNLSSHPVDVLMMENPAIPTTSISSSLQPPTSATSDRESLDLIETQSTSILRQNPKTTGQVTPSPVVSCSGKDSVTGQAKVTATVDSVVPSRLPAGQTPSTIRDVSTTIPASLRPKSKTLVELTNTEVEVPVRNVDNEFQVVAESDTDGEPGSEILHSTGDAISETSRGSDGLPGKKNQNLETIEFIAPTGGAGSPENFTGESEHPAEFQLTPVDRYCTKKCLSEENSQRDWEVPADVKVFLESCRTNEWSMSGWAEDDNEVAADVKAFLETSKKVVLTLGPEAANESKTVVNNPLFQPTSHVVHGQQEHLFTKSPTSILELETLLVTSADRRQSGCGVEGLQIVGSELTELFSSVVISSNSPSSHSGLGVTSDAGEVGHSTERHTDHLRAEGLRRDCGGGNIAASQRVPVAPIS